MVDQTHWIYLFIEGYIEVLSFFLLYGLKVIVVSFQIVLSRKLEHNHLHMQQRGEDHSVKTHNQKYPARISQIQENSVVNSTLPLKSNFTQYHKSSQFHQLKLNMQYT